jgi:hypothetical protein
MRLTPVDGLPNMCDPVAVPSRCSPMRASFSFSYHSSYDGESGCAPITAFSSSA